MSDVFEVREWDAAGRLGELTVPGAGGPATDSRTVATPALMPVVNPHLQVVSPARLEAEFGAEVLITNAYVFHQSEEFRDAALDRGLHDVLSFSGVIATDSGAYQLAEYGEIDVTTEEILRFQREVGADIATPVDVPTPPDASRDAAEADLRETSARLDRAEAVDTGEMLVTAPVQGGTYPELRERAGRDAADTGLDVFPVGGVVPLLSEYRFDDVVAVVVAAKRGLGPAAPVHLFGAGHPMTFALAVAMGCDLFDSAAYAIYARDDRYLTVRGTEHLADLEYFPCSCPVCTDHDPDEVRAAGDRERERLLAEHNLYASFAEVRRIRQALRRGNLLELLETRARAHPDLLDGYRALLAHADWLENTDPVSKDTFFYLSPESASRPEVVRHHDRLGRLSVDGEHVLLTEGGRSDEFDSSWRVLPPFGPFPPALSETYPLTAEVPGRTDRAAADRAAEGVGRLVEANPDVEFTLSHRGWPAAALARVPDRVELVDIATGSASRW